MDYLETIAQKRLESASKLERDFDNTKANSTVKASSSKLGETFKEEHEKNRNHTHKVEVNNFPEIAKPSDIQSVVTAVQNLTTAQPEELKPVVEELKRVVIEIEKLPKDFPSMPSFPKFPEIPKATTINNLSDIQPWLSEISEAIEKLKLDPKITVTPAEVVVQQEKVDLSPLITAVKDLKPMDRMRLGEYRAQDIWDDDTFQYVGFVAPDGGWYIIENDIREGSLRYRFGTKNYKSNWKSRVNQSYKLLNEAIHEIQA